MSTMARQAGTGTHKKKQRCSSVSAQEKIGGPKAEFWVFVQRGKMGRLSRSKARKRDRVSRLLRVERVEKSRKRVVKYKNIKEE